MQSRATDIADHILSLGDWLIRVRGEVRVRDGLGDGFRVRVRDRASVRARGRLGFIYYCRNMLELNLGPSGKKQKTSKFA